MIAYLIAIHAVVLYFVGERLVRRYVEIKPVSTETVLEPGEQAAIPTPVPVPETFADQYAANVNANVTPGISPPVMPTGLLIPVLGVKPEQLIDTFSSSRSEGRLHDAIDIAAPAGTPVVAATDGEIVRFFDSERGGITIYQLADDKKFMLYYAHLQRRADEISVGTHVRRGTTIGFVGDTGNAGIGNYHLHFSIAMVTDPKRSFEGTPINPYPFLKTGTYPQ